MAALGIFNGYFLVSDVDGTLAPDFDPFPQNNVDAVRFFKEEGGRFTIATGRLLSSAQEAIQQFELTEPLILGNGSSVYDLREQRTLFDACLPACAAQYAKDFLKNPKLLNMRVTLIDGETISVYVRPDATHHPFVPARYNHATRSIDDLVSLRWSKVLMIFEPSDIQLVMNQVTAKPLPKVSFTIGGDRFFEMLPDQVSKGRALQMVAERIGIDRDHILAIGDYDNDVEMLQFAGFAACPANAVDSVKAAADLVVCDAREGAVAELIHRLESALRRARQESDYVSPPMSLLRNHFFNMEVSV